MKCRDLNSLVASIAMLALAPAVALAQPPCAAKPPTKIIRPYFPVDYGPNCYPGGKPQHGAYAQNSTAGGVPFTLRNVIRTFDAIIPCGPRSGHGCGFCCIGAGSGCMGVHCNRDIMYCPQCGAPPFSCNCYGNCQAVYAPPGVLLRASQCCYDQVPAEQAPVASAPVEPSPRDVRSDGR